MSPESFLGLETSCSDSDPYDNFTLTCSASRESNVSLNLVTVWYYNGTVQTGNITIYDGGDLVTNTLKFNTTTAVNNSGNYTCTVRYDGDTQGLYGVSYSSIVTIKGEYYILLNYMIIFYRSKCSLYCY